MYMIYQLKRVGINQNDLARICVFVIRPVVEYACAAWHTNFPKYLSNNIEIIQKRCLKTMFPAWFDIRGWSADGKHTNAARQAQ